MVTYDVWRTGFASLSIVFLVVTMTYGTCLVIKIPIWNDIDLEVATWKSVLALISLICWTTLGIAMAAYGIGNIVLWASELLGLINVPQ